MAIFRFGPTAPSLLHWQPWWSVCLLLGWGQTYADLVLIEDGQPRSTIVVGAHRSEKEHLNPDQIALQLGCAPREGGEAMGGSHPVSRGGDCSHRIDKRLGAAGFHRVARTEAHLRAGDGDTQEADAGGALRFVGVSQATTSAGVSLERSTPRVSSSAVKRQLVPAARS